MTEDEVRNWIAAYGHAWEARDPDAAAQLFSEDVEYYETPFEDPFRGREGVRSYWAGATGSQQDIWFAFTLLAAAPNRGVAQWTAEFTRVATGKRHRLDGALALDFDGDGLCRVLREWWHQQER